ncbi:MAG: hypothetical protein JNL09_04795 [Anaerolineales bacterium]|nr:hypothetical protein [Anaerolineales bacterium]
MDLATFQRLLTAEGQQAIAATAELKPTEETFLPALTKLQKQIDADLAKAALETVILRAKAHTKFTRVEQMYFIREALEQASGETIATYRAQRYQAYERVADVCCGLGGDAIGLGGVTSATLVDKDALRLALARENLAAYGYKAEYLEADVTQTPLPPVDALWFDPARRVDGRRKFSVRDYAPPLTLVNEWHKQIPAIGVKLSPGVNLAELTNLPPHEVEFISVSGELKECVLWFGPLKTEAARRATLLPSGQSLISDNQFSNSLSAPRRYLYEPDPAILRAGLVTTLAVQLNAHQLDSEIAYLTSDALTPTPLARVFVIEDAMPFQLKRLREYLRARKVGNITVKKRGSPLTPEELIHKLKLSGPESRIVFLTHVNGEPYVLIGRAA